MDAGGGFAVAAQPLMEAGTTVGQVAARVRGVDAGSVVREVAAALPGSAAAAAAEDLGAAWSALGCAVVAGLAVHGKQLVAAAEQYRDTDAMVAAQASPGGSPSKPGHDDAVGDGRRRGGGAGGDAGRRTGPGGGGSTAR